MGPAIENLDPLEESLTSMETEVGRWCKADALYREKFSEFFLLIAVHLREERLFTSNFIVTPFH